MTHHIQESINTNNNWLLIKNNGDEKEAEWHSSPKTHTVIQGFYIQQNYPLKMKVTYSPRWRKREFIGSRFALEKVLKKVFQVERKLLQAATKIHRKKEF